MKTLPVRPVETLAMHRTAAPDASRNTGIIPPWMQRNVADGIVPPWLETTTDTTRPGRNPSAQPGRNPGIVPPWLQGRPVAPDAPVADDVPRILAATQATGFDPTPIVVDVPVRRAWNA